jgi:two-component system LytT family sensor kinase
MKILKLQIKKSILTIIGFLAMGITAFCRPALPDSNRFLYDFPFSSNLGIRFKNNGKIKSNVYEGLRWGSNQPARSNSFRSIIIDGECSVELCSLDINEKNAGEYRYRVVKNFNEPLAPWIRPSVFIASGNSKIKYAYLGQFNYAPRQVLKVEIYDIKYGGLQDAIRIDWQKIEPATVRGFIQFASGRLHFPPDKLVSVEMNTLKKTKGKYNTDFIETTSPKNIKFRLGDSLQNFNFFVSDWPRFYNYKVILKREIKGQTDSVSLGETKALDETNGDFSLDNFDLNKVYWNNPGKYKITFIPKITRIGGQPASAPGNLAANISFTVLPGNGFRPEVSVITLIEVVLVIISIATTIFVYNRIRQKALLAQEMQNRKTTTLQLQSIRSQLNPHFIFNALAGIQNLMNKNEVENANKYLTRFARLTRNILDDGQKELIPIEHEIDLLTDYLQMEQMRFGFNFSINVDHDIDRQIEIPAMLLQPFAENAVKHGVSTLKNKGEIIIGIFKKDKNLRLIVQDNGKGFSDSKPAGMGIRLCEDRIKLLNSIYKNTSILLSKSSGSDGTLITIELNNWL